MTAIPTPLFQAPIPLRPPTETTDPLTRVEGKVDRLAERVDRITTTSKDFGRALARLERAARVVLDDIQAIKGRLNDRDDAGTAR
jgi:hypothetical protein